MCRIQIKVASADDNVLGVGRFKYQQACRFQNAQRFLNIDSARGMIVVPGVFIFLTVLAVNFIGNGLRDALDPRLKQ